MPLPLKNIHYLEIREDYPAAINALEERVRHDRSDHESVVRLGFNLWYAVAEAQRLNKTLPVEDYATRFMDLFEAYRQTLHHNADFCWAFGLGMSLFVPRIKNEVRFLPEGPISPLLQLVVKQRNGTADIRAADLCAAQRLHDIHDHRTVNEDY